MKTIATILFLLTVLCNASAKTYTQQCWENYINLSGHYNEDKLSNETHTRNLPILPIAAFLDGTDLYFEFSSAISDLNIILIKENVEIENRTISVEEKQYTTFSLSKYGKGNYQIALTTPQGTYLCGEFDL